MGPDVKRNTRINDLYKKAISRRYTWNEIREFAHAIGVSNSTAESYLVDVISRMKKAGYIK